MGWRPENSHKNLSSLVIRIFPLSLWHTLVCVCITKLVGILNFITIRWKYPCLFLYVLRPHTLPPSFSSSPLHFHYSINFFFVGGHSQDGVCMRYKMYRFHSNIFFPLCLLALTLFHSLTHSRHKDFFPALLIIRFMIFCLFVWMACTIITRAHWYWNSNQHGASNIILAIKIAFFEKNHTGSLTSRSLMVYYVSLIFFSLFFFLFRFLCVCVLCITI